MIYDVEAKLLYNLTWNEKANDILRNAICQRASVNPLFDKVKGHGAGLKLEQKSSTWTMTL